jgi:hypothetical protein
VVSLGLRGYRIDTHPANGVFHQLFSLIGCHL